VEDDDVEEVEDDGELGSCGGMGRNCLVQGSIEEKPCGCCVREILEGGGGGERIGGEEEGGEVKKGGGRELEMHCCWCEL
jgi:hypothetical protein